MLQSIKKKYTRWGNRRSWLRVYQFFTALLVVALALFLYSTNLSSNENFRADSWSQMSISIGASVLTLVAIITSIGLSNENNRRLEFNENLNGILNRIDKKNNPDRSFDEIYENSKQKIRYVIDSVPILRYIESLIGIFSFFLFLFSAIFAVMGYPFFYTFGFFAYGIVFLIGYVMYVIEEFAIMDRFSNLSKPKGVLRLLRIKINGAQKEFELKNKEVLLKLTKRVERIEFKVRFEGTTRNGFLHAIAKYKNGLSSHIPDSNTYLATFGFIDNYHLTLLEKEFDTGILQVEKSIDLTFEVILRGSKGTEENPLLGKGLVGGFEKEVYSQCSIPENYDIEAIELRMYEDPLYRPNMKRREIDCIIFKINKRRNRAY